MKLGKIAFFALVGLTGCGADDGGRHVATSAAGGEGSGATGGGGSGSGEGGSSGGSSGSGGVGGSGGGAGGSGGGAGGSAGTSGAGGTGSPELDPATAAAIGNIDANLERLRALQVVEIKGLIVDREGETGNCYGLPCPGDAPSVEARGKAALRLQKLVEVAEFAIDVEYVPAACIDRVDANLAALRALAIVEVGTFLRTEPANNPLCYNLPCASDIEAAAVENEARAADLELIANGAQPL
jgi:hypothetical protein